MLTEWKALDIVKNPGIKS